MTCQEVTSSNALFRAVRPSFGMDVVRVMNLIIQRISLWTFRDPAQDKAIAEDDQKVITDTFNTGEIQKSDQRTVFWLRGKLINSAESAS